MPAKPPVSTPFANNGLQAARLQPKNLEKRISSLQNSTVASRAAMNHNASCGVGIVLTLQDEVVISELIEGGPAQR